VIYVNERCQIGREGSALVVLVSGLPGAHLSDEDQPAAVNAMVMLVEHGWAQQVEVARASDRDVCTVRRAQQRYDEADLAALGRAAGYERLLPSAPPR
jgi:hypothetical protein